jgi:hypothetical protein
MVADLQGRLEHHALELVDHLVLADEVLGELGVAQREALLGLADLGAHELGHLVDPLENVRMRGWFVPVERDQLGDVHALVAHALDVMDDVQERGHDAQVAGHRCLRRHQGQDALVHLEVAAVDPVVVVDDEAGQLDVLVVERLDRAVERGDDHVEAAEGLLLQALELLLEADPRGLGRHQPTFPVTYASVRSSLGLVKIFSVSSYSTM